MKKKTGLVFALAILMILSGCSKNTPNAEIATDPASIPKTGVVAFEKTGNEDYVFIPESDVWEYSEEYAEAYPGIATYTYGDSLISICGYLVEASAEDAIEGFKQANINSLKGSQQVGSPEKETVAEENVVSLSVQLKTGTESNSEKVEETVEVIENSFGEWTSFVFIDLASQMEMNAYIHVVEKDGMCRVVWGQAYIAADGESEAVNEALEAFLQSFDFISAVSTV